MNRLLTWADKKVAWLPVVTFIVVLAAFILVYRIGNGWLPLSSLSDDGRTALFSALSGASAGLLGFTMAALAIIVALSTPSSLQVQRGREGLKKVLLITSFTLLADLTVTLLAMSFRVAPIYLQLSVVSLSIACSLGLLTSVVAFALAVSAP